MKMSRFVLWVVCHAMAEVAVVAVVAAVGVVGVLVIGKRCDDVRDWVSIHGYCQVIMISIGISYAPSDD